MDDTEPCVADEPKGPAGRSIFAFFSSGGSLLFLLAAFGASSFSITLGRVNGDPWAKRTRLFFCVLSFEPTDVDVLDSALRDESDDSIAASLSFLRLSSILSLAACNLAFPD